MTDATRVRRWPLVLLAALGLFLSLASELVHYRAYTKPESSSFCAVGEQLDCVAVALSTHSVLLSIPLPLWGVAGFLAIGIAAWLRSRWVLPLAAVAALASVVLLVLEITAIHAVCLLCEGVHALSIALFIVAYRSRKGPLLPFSDRESSLLSFGLDAGKAQEKAEQIVKKGTVSGGSTCSAACKGEASAGLQSALSGRAGQARGCYDRALRNNNMLEGRMSVAVKISSTGHVCSANIVKNEVGDPGLTSCVLQMFRSGTFPQPKGGCVDAQVPLNFKKRD